MQNRLQQFLDKKKLTPANFAEIVGVQRSGISHILSGRNNPSIDFIRKMLENFPDLNTDWFITGKGNMFKSELIDNLNQSDLTSQKTLFAVENKVNDVKEVIMPEKTAINDELIITTPPKKEIERIVIFHKSGTFIEYKPES